MKHGSGMKDLDDKSSGIEILMTETLTKINPTDPLTLTDDSRWVSKNSIDFSFFLFS